MNLLENIKVALNALGENGLRSRITVGIIAIGIFALVGILTAVDLLQASVDSSFSGLGANSFDIASKNDSRRSLRGQIERNYEPIKYSEAKRFQEKMEGIVSISSIVSFAAEAKYGSQTTNPNLTVVGADENYLVKAGFNLKNGRNFSRYEVEKGAYVIIIGSEIADKLFKTTFPLQRTITVMSNKYKVIGVLEKKGSDFGGGGADRSAIIPLNNARTISAKELTFDINVKVLDPTTIQMEPLMEEARGIMRVIRKDPPGQEDSFEISSSEALTESSNEIFGYIRIGGVVISAIILVGAAIGLMNIMLVSVTERTREIGVRMALGATPRRIQQQFLIEALTICQIGGIAGIILGIVVANLVALIFGSSSFVIPWGSMIVGVIVCLIVGMISGFYPSYKASRLDPIESLRFE